MEDKKLFKKIVKLRKCQRCKKKALLDLKQDVS